MRKLYLFSVLFMLLANCQKKEPLEDLEQASVETVGVNEAIDFLSSKNVLSRGTSPDYVVFDLEGIVHEEITNSNELLTVVPATTVYEAHYSRILLLKIEGTIQTAVFSMYPSEEATDDVFSGEIMITDMDGNFLNGYRVSNGVLVAQFAAKPVENSDGVANRMAKLSCPSHGECTPNTDCVICIQELAEIIIVSNDRDTNPGSGNTNYFPIMDIYYGGTNGPIGPVQNTGLEWDYGGGDGYNGSNDKEVWDCGRGKAYNPRTKACECPDGMVDNGYECVVAKVEIKNNLTNTCAKTIFSQLEIEMVKKDLLQKIMKPTAKVNLTFSESILKLFNDSDKHNYTIKNEKLRASTAASTIGISTTMNDLYLKNATNLSIARTMIHEMTHAFLNVKYSDPFYTGFDFRKKMELYAQESGCDINDVERFHHEFMGQYIDAIAVSLFNWDNEYGTGGKLEWDYYKAMAFGGLFIEENDQIMETYSFQILVPNQSDRNKIINILNNEQNGNSNAKGKKCN